jgi:pyruvate/2-oxoglutarate dehydrogenase complex dihydrolipoamide acyltransferase (E2) component
MPAMGTSVVEGTIVEWHVGPGDPIAADAPICEISTDKVDSECPSPATGTLAEVLVPAGETVAVGTVLARIDTGGGADAAPPAPADAAATDRRDAPDGAASSPDGVASSPGGPASSAEPVAAAAEAPAPKDGLPAGGAGPSRRERLRGSSPVAARIADEHGLDVTRLQGSGRHGRVTKRDVLDAVAQGTGTAAPAAAPDHAAGAGDDAPMHIESPYRPDPSLLVAGAPAVPAGGATGVVPPTTPAIPAVPPAPPVPPAPARASAAASAPATPPAVPDDLGGVVTPMSRMRSSIGTAMRRALDTAAHCTTVVECDMSRIERRRRELGVTALPLLGRHAIDALREFPALNATFDGETLRRYDRVHLGIAVSLGEEGLIVPVLHDAQDLSAEGIARRIKDVAGRARARQLSPDEVRGGTFTITNPGASGALIATPVINVPQVAILDLEAIVRRPVVVTDPDGQESIAIRPMVNLCMSWDHRVLDGVYAARFLTALRGRIEGGAAD